MGWLYYTPEQKARQLAILAEMATGQVSAFDAHAERHRRMATTLAAEGAPRFRILRELLIARSLYDFVGDLRCGQRQEVLLEVKRMQRQVRAARVIRDDRAPDQDIV